MMGRSVFLGVLFSFIGAMSYIFYDELSELLYIGDPRLINAEIEFVNDCSIATSNFVIRDTVSGRTATISQNRAHLQVLEGTPLEVQLVNRFPDVKFAGYTQKARKKMRMVANCDQSERVQGTVRSLTDRFGD
ncbi:MAG: hypothetical protein ACON5C_09810 [Alphaproteobacteria bacterium]